MTHQVISGSALGQWYRQAQAIAQEAGIPRTEVDWLLQSLAGIDRLTLRLQSFQESYELPISLAELTQLWQRRLQERIPVQYLTGVAYWRKFCLKVSPAVLIPRPETELIVDLAVEAALTQSPLSSSNWVDLGTGSGAIAIGLAEALPTATIYAVDRSSAALNMAQQNADRLGFSARIQFYEGSWWEPLDFLKGQVCGMVSNPPYIPSDRVSTLQPEVARHEPHTALDGGTDGLESIRHLIATAPDYLESGGVWLVEMMAGQAEAVAELLRSQGQYRDVQIHCDLAGIERFALAYRT